MSGDSPFETCSGIRMVNIQRWQTYSQGETAEQPSLAQQHHKDLICYVVVRASGPQSWGNPWEGAQERRTALSHSKCFWQERSGDEEIALGAQQACPNRSVSWQRTMLQTVSAPVPGTKAGRWISFQQDSAILWARHGLIHQYQFSMLLVFSALFWTNLDTVYIFKKNPQ